MRWTAACQSMYLCVSQTAAIVDLRHGGYPVMADLLSTRVDRPVAAHANETVAARFLGRRPPAWEWWATVRQELEEGIRAASSREQHWWNNPGASSEEATEETVDKSSCKRVVIVWCIVYLCVTLPILVTGEPQGQLTWPQAARIALEAALIIYVFGSGLWSHWWSGKPTDPFCRVTCWLVTIPVFLFLCMIGCLCCGLGVAAGAAVVIKNLSIKAMHEKYEEEKGKLSGPRREYYESELFQRKCDDMFDKLDADRNGTLDMSELQPMIEEEFQGQDAMWMGQFGQLLRSAFDENGNSKVEKDEFKHMMQFISMVKFQEGRFTEDSAWEVLQVDPKTGTHEQVKRSYKKLSLKYHPDKRRGVPEEELRRDMAEINDAKRLLDQKFDPSPIQA